VILLEECPQGEMKTPHFTDDYFMDNLIKNVNDLFSYFTLCTKNDGSRNKELSGKTVVCRSTGF